MVGFTARYLSRKTNPSRFEQGLDDEDGSDEGGEDVLGELGEVLDDEGALEASHRGCYDQAPEADPDPPGQVLNLGTLGELEQGLVVDHHRPGHT